MCLQKILLKYMQVGSCFEDLFKRDTGVQPELEIDGWFKNYNYLMFLVACMCHSSWVAIIVLGFHVI